MVRIEIVNGQTSETRRSTLADFYAEFDIGDDEAEQCERYLEAFGSWALPQSAERIRVRLEGAGR